MGITKVFTENKTALVGAVIIIAFLFIAILAPLLAPFSPDYMDPANRLMGSSKINYLH